jgi:hypothetical protein
MVVNVKVCQMCNIAMGAGRSRSVRSIPFLAGRPARTTQGNFRNAGSSDVHVAAGTRTCLKGNRPLVRWSLHWGKTAPRLRALAR